MDGMLSQEEIDALTNGGEDSGAETQEGYTGESLTDAERDAVGEIANINMGTAATTLSTLLNSKVTITTPRVSYVTLDDLSSQYDRPCVFIHISYIEGIDGNNVLILKEHDVKVITDLMMGGDGTNTDGEISELHLSAISEAMNQMMGSSATSLSSMLEKKIDISPPSASLVDLNDTIVDNTEISDFLSGVIVQVAFDMQIGDLIDSQIMQLYPFDFARELYEDFTNNMSNENTTTNAAQEPAAAPAAAPTPAAAAPTPEMPAGQPAPAPAPMPQMDPNMMQQPYMMPMQNVNVQPAQFQPFNAGVSPLMQQENIDLIMDVPLEVTVELGRSNKSIKEILDFAPGTIIELNKLAGEPVDVLVNGKFVARGEVVVIEENFGIRIVEISK
ncbi:MAG: flagellar motor switch phosphatase FliY [Lachnospiraceae bacterium]|nr:flagellar motor switch phosphatase FliY [Lachnospiraceae bacterium]